jgi:REP element-mobilizing transposase RayT
MSDSQNAHRLRNGRYSQPSRIYLLTAVTHLRQPYFQNWQTGRQVVQEFRRAQDSGTASSIAWVVMPEHFHWLIELHDGDLSRLMQTTKSRSARHFNQHRGFSGAVWQKGYFDRALRREEDLKTAARYIIANPLRAGLVSRIGDYPLWDAMWL